ncbi:unnamed protein product [Leptidea sinapis]|uniref:Transmembrane protein n=1 Tax=Leptidea sinapis TaxID=189913 RepID=A0A5E4QRQ6_9NEOP|nr:unnamed protein product [Leptidea sinapis]
MSAKHSFDRNCENTTLKNRNIEKNMASEKENHVTKETEEVRGSIDELKERLSSMKRILEDRNSSGSGTKDLFQGHAPSMEGTTMIDGSFLSFVFGGSLVVIISVSFYAFYNLYHAVLKKFPSPHTEL